MVSKYLYYTLFLSFLITNSVFAEKNTLRIGTIALPSTIGNPFRNTGPPHLFTWSATYDGLTRFDQNGYLKPWLAISWERKDNLTWVLKLRKKVKFSNGKLFNAESVVTTLNFLTSDKAYKEAVAKEFEFIKSAHSLDDITVKIITKRPIPLLPRSLPLLHVIEPEEWKKLGPDKYAKQPLGTGPYKLVNYSPGVFKYESFKDSWRPPIIPKLEIIAVPDSFMRAQGVISGQLDIAMSIGPEEVNIIKNNGGKGLDWLSASLWAINFHHGRGTPLDNVLVRKALNLAVDRKSLITGLLEGRTLIATQPSPKIAYGYNYSLKNIKYDPEKAKSLLHKAGYPDGFKFVVEGVLGAGANHAAMYQKVAQDLAIIGITMEVRPFPITQLIRGVMQGDWKGDAFGSTYATEPTLDVLRPLRNHSCLWPYAWYCDKRIMPTIKKAMITFNKDESIKLRNQIMSFYRKEWVSLFLYESIRFAGTASNIRGFSEDHGFINYEKIYFKK